MRVVVPHATGTGRRRYRRVHTGCVAVRGKTGRRTAIRRSRRRNYEWLLHAEGSRDARTVGLGFEPRSLSLPDSNPLTKLASRDAARHSHGGTGIRTTVAPVRSPRRGSLTSRSLIRIHSQDSCRATLRDARTVGLGFEPRSLSLPDSNPLTKLVSRDAARRSHGGTGIRTQEAVRLPAFKAGAMGHSAIPP